MLVKTSDLAPWRGEPLAVTIDTATVTFEDGRVDTIKVEPYLVMRTYSLNVETLWTKEQLLAVGLLRVVPATAPVGKMLAGLPTYRRDGDLAREVRELEDLPPEPVTVTIGVDEHERLVADAEKWRTRDVAPAPTTEEKS